MYDSVGARAAVAVGACLQVGGTTRVADDAQNRQQQHEATPRRRLGFKSAGWGRLPVAGTRQHHGAHPRTRARHSIVQSPGWGRGNCLSALASSKPAAVERQPQIDLVCSTW